MKIDNQIAKQTEILLKFLSKGFREEKEVSPAKIQAYAKLLGEYRSLIESSRQDGDTNNWYETMERQALKEVKGNY